MNLAKSKVRRKNKIMWREDNEQSKPLHYVDKITKKYQIY